MKTRVKNVVILVVLWSLLIVTGAYAQNWSSRSGWDTQSRWDEVPSIQVAGMVGVGAGEISATYTHSLIFGLAVSGINSTEVEKRATNNSYGKKHDFKTSIVPATFLLIGGEFEELSLISKLGASYIDKDIFFAVGIIADYKITDVIGLRASYDNTNSLMGGITIHFKQ